MDIFLFEKRGDLTNHCVGVIHTSKSLQEVSRLVTELIGGSCIVQQEGSCMSVRWLPLQEQKQITKKLKTSLSV